MTQKILVVDDEKNHRESLSRIFSRAGYQVEMAKAGPAALAILSQQAIDVLVTDLIMPQMDGFRLMAEAKKIQNELDVLLMTAYGSVDHAVQAIRLGAYDFIVKPVKRNEILASVQRIFEKRALIAENKALKERIKLSEGLGELLGISPSIISVNTMIQQIAPSSVAVWIDGEQGTGKELCARAIHHFSEQTEQQFLHINCALLSDEILEQKLLMDFTTKLGEEKLQYMQPLLEIGSLFIEEVAHLSLAMQAKLLIWIDEVAAIKREQNKGILRLIASSSHSLDASSKPKNLREDLYYRLNVIAISMPSLQQRREDIPLLATYFMKKMAEKHAKRVGGIADDALKALSLWDFPGNVRELENAMERAVVLCQGTMIEVSDLPQVLQKHAWASIPQSPQVIHFRIGSKMEQMERAAIKATMNYTGGDKIKTAKILGISVRTVYRRLEDTEDDSIF